MQALLEKIRSRRILVVGDLMLDRYLWGDATRISPEAPVPVVARIHDETLLFDARTILNDEEIRAIALGLALYFEGDKGTGALSFRLEKRK